MLSKLYAKLFGAVNAINDDATAALVALQAEGMALVGDINDARDKLAETRRALRTMLAIDDEGANETPAIEAPEAPAKRRRAAKIVN